MLRIFPLILSWLSFWLLYSVVPTTRVPNRDAVVGALVAAVLFELGKRGLPFTSPCSLLSAHLRRTGGDPHFVCLGLLDWCIVLLGAEITVTLGVYRELKKQQKLKTTRSRPTMIALIQRVTRASVTVEGEVTGEIGPDF